MTPPAGGLDVPVVRADSADLDILSLVIAEAFHDLAPSRWLIADPAARREIFPGYFRILAEHALANGVVHTTPGRTAAALWLPVGEDGPAQPLDYDARLPVATRPWTSRFLAFDAALDRHHPTGIPHHHLAILAVSPQRQGQGTGTALLRAYHQMLDHDARVPAYLEASDLRTRQIYLRHGGYTDHGPPIQLPDDGPQMYPLWRECRPAAVTAGGHGERAGHPARQQIPPLPRRIPKRRHTTMHPTDNRPHPAPSGGQDAALDNLAAELHVRGYQAHLIAPAGRPPSLAVTNPHAAVLAETVMADATSFWWPWADRIAAVADVAGAAEVIARVLAAVPGDGPG
jgi:GNAT superfamily N-acetyltransferase